MFSIIFKKFLKKLIKWQAKAEKTTIIIIGIVRIIFGIFIPFIIFAELGLLAGYAFHTTTKEFNPPHEEKEHQEHFEEPPKENPPPANEEEHH